MRKYFLYLILSIILSGMASAQEKIEITNWKSLGPFPVGTREGYIDHLMPYGGEEMIAPEENQVFYSMMVAGGKLNWKKADYKDGRITLKYGDINWNFLDDQYGFAGSANIGYAYAEYYSDSDKVLLITPDRVAVFYVNGIKYYGDTYGAHYIKVPVPFRKGLNRILVKCSRYGQLNFNFGIGEVTEPIYISERDVTYPDLIKGEVMDGFMALPLINTTDEALKNIDIIIEDTEFISRSHNVFELLPFTSCKVPVPLKTKPSFLAIPASLDSHMIKITVKCRGFSKTVELKLRIKDNNERHRRTFRADDDLSIQHFSVLPPENFDPEKKYALVLSLHGAGVHSDNQIGAYTKKDWAFIVAPTNRREFGFDWQDWGRLHMLQVLEELKKLYNIDSNRIYLTGHSMGGHGTWHIGLHHADLFAAIAPSAGWTSFHMYVPFTLQKGYLYATPQWREIKDAALREERMPVFLRNSLNVPKYILHGGTDDNVPATQARRMLNYMHNMGIDNFIYHEEPGKGHWWGLPGIEGSACVNHPEIFNLFREKTRDEFPLKVSFTTNNPGLNNKMYWVRIDALDELYKDANIETEILPDKNKIIIKAKNISQFSLFPPEKHLNPGNLILSVNDKLISADFIKNRPVTLFKAGNGFKKGSLKKLTKTPGMYGPVKQAYYSPFVFVYGTSGSREDTEINLHTARIQAQEWWRRANGYVRIIPDREVTEEIIREYNLILFGTPESNSVISGVNKDLPIKIQDSKIYIGRKQIEGKNLCVKMIYPNPKNRKKFVLLYSGNSMEGVKLSTVMHTMYAAAGLPDFIIYGKNVKVKGWGGIKSAGFFDKKWELDKNLYFIDN